MVDLEHWSDKGRAAMAAPAPELPQEAREAIVPRVLVIDDDSEVHRLLRARLEVRGGRARHGGWPLPDDLTVVAVRRSLVA